MSIKVQTTFPSSLPKNQSYRAQILAASGLTKWWVSGEGETASSGYLSAWVDIKSSAGAYGGSSGKAPAINATAINNQKGYVFDGSNDAVAFTASGSSDFAGNFSIVTLFQAPLPASLGYPFSTFEGIQVGTWVTLTSAGNISINHGNGTSTLPFSANKPSVLIMGSSFYYLNGRYNGLDFPRVTTNNASGAQALVAGCLSAAGAGSGYAAMTLAEVMIFNRDITNDGALVNLIETYAADSFMYNVALS